MKFKKGDKVKIPTQKTPYDSYNRFKSELKSEWKYLTVDSTNTVHIGLSGPNRECIISNAFSEEDLEPYTEYNIHEIKHKKFVIHCTSAEQGRKVSSYGANTFNKIPGGMDFQGSTNFCVRLDDKTCDGWEIGTKYYEQKGYQIIEFDQINFETMQEKKVIGYKVPMDYYNGKIKKGTILSRKDEYGEYTLEEDDENAWYLPAELVETWEKVYEEDFKEGDIVVILDTENVRGYNPSAPGNLIKLTNIEGGNSIQRLNEGGNYAPPDNTFAVNFRKTDFRKATEEEARLYVAPVRGYHPKIGKGTVAFGCQSFTTQDLESILKVYNTEIGGYIVIDDTRIGADTIVRLINLSKNAK